ncbi:MAG: glycosyltransferase family protein, partial [Stellaceae bacterium]
ADMIRPETLAAIRGDLPRMRVLQWNADPVFEADNIDRIKSKLAVVDATLVTTAGDALEPLRRPGMRLGFLPNPVDFSVERGRNHAASALPYDLFYACGNPRLPARHCCGKVWDMEEFMSALRAAVPDLRLLLAGLCGQPHLAGSQYQRALESAALGLNVSRRNDVFLYSSDRLSHMIGNGLAVLIERATGYDRLFSEDQMAFFATFDELVEQVRRLAADPARRSALAAAGRERYHELFNEQRVAHYLHDVAFGTIDAANYPWPTLIA